MATFELVDDGTLDTVIRCLDCGGLERFHTDFLTGDDENTDEVSDEERINNALSAAEMLHDCEEEATYAAQD